MDKNTIDKINASDLKSVKEKLNEVLRENGLDKIYHTELKSDAKDREYISVVDDVGIGMTLDYNRVDGLTLIPAIEVRDERGQWSSLAFNVYTKEHIELMQIFLNLISDTNGIGEKKIEN